MTPRRQLLTLTCVLLLVAPRLSAADTSVPPQKLPPFLGLGLGLAVVDDVPYPMQTRGWALAFTAGRDLDRQWRLQFVFGANGHDDTVADEELRFDVYGRTWERISVGVSVQYAFFPSSVSPIVELLVGGQRTMLSWRVDRAGLDDRKTEHSNWAGLIGAGAGLRWLVDDNVDLTLTTRLDSRPDLEDGTAWISLLSLNVRLNRENFRR